eukprot:TRINITY_DN3589_c0_g1_i5.p2 TRINITY_DN3589_c0_g1~~TRINITY_DN3589_c0_g1_i5.p2  ORF type:complete len:205 (-),score=14.65 TRINITY_DN3589_c0_g1_i5:436-1050(-)
MASILKGYAREQLYFKREQEADLWQHYQKLVKNGQLPRQIPEPLPGQGIQHTPEEAEAATKVLFEILQQSSRLSDPKAHIRRDIRIRGKLTPPPLSARAQCSLPSAFDSRDLVKQLRNSFDPSVMKFKPSLSPQEISNTLLLAKDTSDLHAVEVGWRQFATAFRVMSYATVFTFLGFGTIITALAYTTKIPERQPCKTCQVRIT